MMIPEDQNEEHYTAENTHTYEGIDDSNSTTAQRKGNNNSKLEKLGKVHLTR